MGEAFISRRGAGGEVKLTFDLATFGNTTPFKLASNLRLSAYRSRITGGQNKRYAIFAGGGSNSSTYTTVVDALSHLLVLSTPTALTEARSYMGSSQVGEYCIFAGGWGVSGIVDIVEAYNASLVRSTPTALSSPKRKPGASRVGNYALFAGGDDANYRDTSSVDAYNASLVRSSPTALSVARSDLSGANVGDYALFAGGVSGGYNDTVDAYNSSLVRSTPTALSSKRAYMGAASNRNYALFAGGGVNTVDAYNTSLARSTPTGLSLARREIAGISMGGLLAIFAGGVANNSSGSSVNQKTVDAYDLNLTRTVLDDLTTALGSAAVACINSYAVVTGGDSSPITSALDIYTLGKMLLPAPKDSSYEINNLSGTVTSNTLLEFGLPATGWIKIKNGNFN